MIQNIVVLPGDDDSVGAKELRRCRSLRNVEISGDGVRAVLLLDVGQNEHAVGAD